MRLGVDTHRLAVPGALLAAVALVRIYHRTEQGEFRQESQHRPHRAHRVAPQPSPAERQESYQHKGHCGHCQRHSALHPHIRLVEGIAPRTLGKIGTQIVYPYIHRLEQIRRNASVGAVRGYQDGDSVQPQHHQHHKQRQHRPAQPLAAFRVVETVFLPPSTQPAENILHHTHRAHHRAVRPAHQQRHHDKKQHHRHIQRQHRRQQLHLCQPA